MGDPALVALSGGLMEAMGQDLASIREVPEGVLAKTSDGFLHAFISDPAQISLAFVQRLLAEVGEPAGRLVLLTRGRVPLALSAEVLRHGGTVVDSARFEELVRGLGLGTLIGEEPRAARVPGSNRMLPSVQQLEDVLGRARTWQSWGVPALALRFYRQAVGMKPEYLPARNGVAASLLGLGLPDEADRAYDEVLAIDETNLDAKLGKAAVLGRRGDAAAEISAYRELLSDDPGNATVQAHLVAALVAEAKWSEARPEIERMIESNPSDPALRYLHGAALERTGNSSAARAERDRSLALGLSFERERALAAQLGLPPPTPREDRPPPAETEPLRPVASPPSKTRAAGRKSTTSSRPVRSRSRRPATAKPRAGPRRPTSRRSSAR